MKNHRRVEAKEGQALSPDIVCRDSEGARLQGR